MTSLQKLPRWPAALGRQDALAFSNVSETTLKTYERLGIVRFKPVGPYGCKVARTADLERMLECIFELGDALPPSEDMEID